MQFYMACRHLSTVALGVPLLLLARHPYATSKSDDQQRHTHADSILLRQFGATGFGKCAVRE